MNLKPRLYPIILFAAISGLTSLMGVAYADDYSDISRLIKSKQYAEAIARADQFLASKPRDPQMRFMKGVAQSEIGKMAEATNTFTRLTEDFPELPEPYNNLAVIYANSNQLDKARAALEMAIRTNPSYATAHENLGDIYARLASQSYAKALQLDTGNTVVPSKLSLIRELFSSVSVSKPAYPQPSTASVQAPAAVNPVVASVQPKIPTAVIASPNAAGKPSVASPVVANAIAMRDIGAAVNGWAQAWSNRDMDAYFASYAKDFNPSNKQSYEAWQEERKQRIMGKPAISVKVSQLSITVRPDGTSATVKFRQEYKADKLTSDGRKTLEMVRSGDRWVITKEITG